MTLQAAAICFLPDGPALRQGKPLPLEALVLGRTPIAAAELLPRLFNLCPVAQGMAARLALGLTDGPPTRDDLRDEVIRDHLHKLCLILPRAFGLPLVALPTGPASLLRPQGLPRDGDPARWTSPLAPLARHVAASFAPGEAITATLPPPPPGPVAGAFENSAAGRQADHPTLRAAEASHGRGPLWRFWGLLADLEAASLGHLPAPQVTENTACLPAARGSYTLRLTQGAGLVTGITRITPTDHQLAPGGALMQALASLPATRRALASQVIALHDPCIPVTVTEAQDA